MKAILFDVDDTLYDQVVPFQKAHEDLFEGVTILKLKNYIKEVAIIVMRSLKKHNVVRCQ